MKFDLPELINDDVDMKVGSRNVLIVLGVRSLMRTCKWRVTEIRYGLKNGVVSMRRKV